jgi:predicted NAD/FAD-binding protein
VDIATPQGTWAIDTGFIVYNDRTYPRFMGLLNELGLSGQKTQMSFSVHNPQSGLEYNGHSLSSLFAQRRNLLKPAFWGLLTEIVRFNRLAKQALAEAFDPGATLQTFLERHRFSLFRTPLYPADGGRYLVFVAAGDAPLPAGAVLALL